MTAFVVFFFTSNPAPAMTTLRYPTVPFVHLFLCLSFALVFASVSQAQPSSGDTRSPIESIHARALQQNYPDLTRTDSDTNRVHVLLVLRDAATYEGPYGGLIDAIAAEPFYTSPSISARSVSAGDVARRLQTLYDDISAGVSISKTSVSEVITDWKSEIEGYESAVKARRIPMFMGEAVRFATWQQALRQ